MCEQEFSHAAQNVAINAPVDWTNAVVIVLAALAVLLTALAIMIGVLAIFGYRGIKDEANRIATDAANKTLADYFTQQSLRDRIRLAVGPSLFPIEMEIEEGHENIGGGEYTGEEQQDDADENGK